VSDRSNPVSRRARTGVGLAFVALAMVVTSVLAGLGFASSAPSAAQYQYGKKIAICHYTGSKKHPWVTLHVNLHSWPGHLQHGDSLGPCPQHPLPPPVRHRKPKPTPKPAKQGHGSNGDHGSTGGHGHSK
jgi:hypothetical protein